MAVLPYAEADVLTRRGDRTDASSRLRTEAEGAKPDRARSDRGIRGARRPAAGGRANTTPRGSSRARITALHSLMLIHLDTSVLVDAFTGARRSFAHVRTATSEGHVITFCAVVQYEWLRGPRTNDEDEAVRRFLGDTAVVGFGDQEAHTAAALYRRVTRARQRQAVLAVAACALEHNARLWTLNTADLTDVPGLTLYQPR